MASIIPSYLEAPNSPHDESRPDNRIRLDITSITQDSASNTTTVSWSLSVVGTPYTALWAAMATLGGKTLYDNHTSQFAIMPTWESGDVIATGSETFQNNADGSLSLSAYVKQMFYYGTGDPTRWDNRAYYQDRSGTLVCSTIQRKAILTFATNFTDNVPLQIGYANLAGNDVTSIEVAISEDGTTPLTSYKTVNKELSTFTLALSQAEINTLRNRATQSYMTMYAILKTTIGSDVFYDKMGTFFSVDSTSETAPVIAISVENTNPLPHPFENMYIQNVSGVSVSITATAKYGATITKTSTIVDQNRLEGDSIVIDPIRNSGSMTIYSVTTDSRGHSTLASDVISVVPYEHPVINKADNTRAIVVDMVNGNLYVSAKKVYNKLMNGNTQINFCKLECRHREVGASSWGNWSTILPENSASDSFTGNVSGVSLETTKAYEVELRVTDTIGSTSSMNFVVREAVTVNAPNGGRILAFGGLADTTKPDSMQVYWDLILHGKIELKGHDIGISDDLTSLTNIPSGVSNAFYISFESQNGIYYIMTTSDNKIYSGFKSTSAASITWIEK